MPENLPCYRDTRPESDLFNKAYYGVNPQHYGWLFAVNIVGVVLLSTINKKLVQKISLEKLLKYSTFVAGAMTLLLCLVVYAKPDVLILVVLCIFIFFSMNGIIAASATAAALDAAEGVTGSASALIGSLQYGSGIISSLILAWLDNGKPWPMVGIMSLFKLMSFFMAVHNNRACSTKS